MLLIGQKIPDFSTEVYHLEKFKKMNSSDFKGKWLVVVFFQRDFTFICSAELRDLAENYDKFTSLGAEILSISVDEALDHKAWHDSSKEISKIKYPMGADPDELIYRLFGIYNYDRNDSISATFIFDADGILRSMETHDNRIIRSSSEILKKLAAAKYVQEHPDELIPTGLEQTEPAINPETPVIGVDRIKTGIDGLDKELHGGLEKYKVFLIAGESGTGKTIFCLQYIYEGLKAGENAIYIVVKEKPNDILEEAKSLGWNLEEYVQSKKLTILDATSYISDVQAGGVLSISRFIFIISKYIHENNAKRLVFDGSIDYIARHAVKSERDTQEFVRGMIFAIEGTVECTTLITSSIPTGKKELSPTGVEESAVSGVIILGAGSEESKRIMNIKKMRETPMDLSKFVYYIIPEKGIVVP